MPRTMASKPSDSGRAYFSSMRSASWTISPISPSTGSPLLIHEVGVVDDLPDLAQHGVAQEVVLLEERLEGAVLTVVGEPGPHHIEELRPLLGLRGIAEEDEGCLRVQEAPNQPYAGGAVHVTPAARGPQHQGLPSAPGALVAASRSLTASRAALSAPAASRRSGERK